MRAGYQAVPETEAVIWWIWTTVQYAMTFDVEDAWKGSDPDVYWLGEGAWTARQDNMSLGLR